MATYAHAEENSSSKCGYTFKRFQKVQRICGLRKILKLAQCTSYNTRVDAVPTINTSRKATVACPTIKRLFDPHVLRYEPSRALESPAMM